MGTEQGITSAIGILISYTGESFNSMINKYCNEGWMELIEGVVQHFTCIISSQHQIFKDKDDHQAVME